MMKNESGRSMVEMLGVLAIIGVLSVGGIAGYTMAMNKYKANEIAAAASQCAVMAVAQATSTGTAVSNKDCASDFSVTVPHSATIKISAEITGSSTARILRSSVTDTGLQNALTGLSVTGSASNGNFTLALS